MLKALFSSYSWCPGVALLSGLHLDDLEFVLRSTKESCLVGILSTKLVRENKALYVAYIMKV